MKTYWIGLLAALLLVIADGVNLIKIEEFRELLLFGAIKVAP